MKLTLAATTFLVLLQGTSPRDLLQLERPLTSNELGAVVVGISRALAGSTVRLVQEGVTDREILFGPGGTPRFVRYSYIGERVGSVTGDTAANRRPDVSTPERFLRLIEYTGLSASYCGGAPASGQMVVEYTQDVKTQRWNVRASGEDVRNAWAIPQLQMLAAPASLRTGGTKNIGRRRARGIVSQSPASRADEFLITGDPAPNPADFQPVETLWIDMDSMLPLRWEVSQREAIVSAVDVIYVPLVITRPARVQVPDCIP